MTNRASAGYYRDTASHRIRQTWRTLGGARPYRLLQPSSSWRGWCVRSLPKEAHPSPPAAFARPVGSGANVAGSHVLHGHQGPWNGPSRYGSLLSESSSTSRRVSVVRQKPPPSDGARPPNEPKAGSRWMGKRRDSQYEPSAITIPLQELWASLAIGGLRHDRRYSVRSPTGCSSATRASADS